MRNSQGWRPGLSPAARWAGVSIAVVHVQSNEGKNDVVMANVNVMAALSEEVIVTLKELSSEERRPHDDRHDVLLPDSRSQEASS